MSSTRVLLGITLAAYCVLAGATLVTKAPNNDEGWYAQPAFRLAAGFTMGTPALETAHAPRFQGLEKHTYWIMPLFIVVQAGVYSVTGASLQQMRLVSLACGLLLILSWYSILWSLMRDRWIAWLTAALVAIDIQVVNVCATGRSDAMCAAFGSAGLAVYLWLRARNLKLAVLSSNTLLVLSGLTHPYGFYYFLALLFLILYFDRRRLSFPTLLAGILPYVVGGAAWAAYILRAPADFLAQFGSNASQRAWVLHHPAQAFLAEVERYRNAYGMEASGGGRHLAAAILLSYVLGVIGILATSSIRRDMAVRPLLWMAGLFCFDLMFLEGAKQPWYLIHFVPSLAALLAIYICRTYANSGAITKRLLIAEVGALAAVSVCLTAALSLRENYQNRYQTVVTFLKHTSRPETTIIGSAELGFGLGFDRVRDDYKLGYYSGLQPDSIVVSESYRAQFQLFEKYRPELWRYVNGRLSNDYVKVFDNGAYAVYSRVQHANRPDAAQVITSAGTSN